MNTMQLAKELGVHYQTVSRIIRKHQPVDHAKGRQHVHREISLELEQIIRHRVFELGYPKK